MTTEAEYHPRTFRLEQPRINAWNRTAEPVMIIASLAFIFAYSAPIINPSMSPTWVSICHFTNIIVWIIFALDYLVKLTIADHRWNYLRYSWFDLLIVVVPFFQPLRLLRLLFLLRVLNRHARSALRGRVAAYVGLGAMLVTFVGAVAVLDLERANPESQISNFADAFWWASVTVLTVGYGDYVPITPMGRLVATVLMFVAIALLGAATGVLSSWLIETVSADKDSETQQLAARIDSLKNQLDRIEEHLEKLDTRS